MVRTKHGMENDASIEGLLRNTKPLNHLRVCNRLHYYSWDAFVSPQVNFRLLCKTTGNTDLCKTHLKGSRSAKLRNFCINRNPII